MKKISLVVACMWIVAPAYGVQEVTLNNVPPLQPLHFCKHSDGHVAEQIDPCASDTTEVSSIGERNSDGSVSFQPLEKKGMTDTADKSAGSAATSEPAAGDQASNPDQNAAGKKPESRGSMNRILQMIGFALAVGLFAKLLLKRSFVLWFILGLVLRMILVAANVMSF